MSEENQIKCTVKVNQIRYYKNNWGILSVSLINPIYGVINTDKHNSFIVKGVMTEPNYQDTFTVVANEIDDPKWGKQYELIYMGIFADISAEDSQKIFLSKILTSRQIENLYNTIENPIQALEDEDIKQLTKVKGIGVTTAVSLIERYKEHVDYSVAYVELDKYGLTPNAIRKIVDIYQSPELAIQKIKENPYILADEVEGIGWKKADSIALSVGIHPHAPERIKAFITYFLECNANDGDSFISPSLLMDGIIANIGDELDDEHLRNVLYDMQDVLWWDEDKTKIGLKKYYDLEFKITEELVRILNGQNNFEYDNWKDKVKQVENNQGWEYSEQQFKGIETVLENQVVMITGLAGTGKSSVVAGMLKVLEDYSFAQCALSGRAAARMTEITNVTGYTIHRLLGFIPGEGFEFNKNNPLNEDIIIVDEVSMIGGYLFYSLIQAVKDGAKLIMLADIGQLESIGVLNVASDIINSEKIPVVRLDKIHRQAQKSAIITESIKVRNGVQLCGNSFNNKEIRGELQDLELDIYLNKEKTTSKVIEKFKENLPKVNSIMDIQVILPMKTNGKSSTFNINQELQNIYNPYNPSMKEIEIRHSKNLSYKLRVNDKVMNVRNNYKTIKYNPYSDNEEDEIFLDDSGFQTFTPIFNGNLGIIKEIHSTYMIIDFYTIGEIIVPQKHWKHIELGYAATCHKFQGSQSPIVIIGLDFNAYMLLTKEWIYTALTRAQQYCVLCAENKALRYAISHNGVSNKKTHLKDMLENYGAIKMKDY